MYSTESNMYMYILKKSLKIESDQRQQSQYSDSI